MHISINVNTKKEWYVVNKNNKIIEKFRLLTTAKQMISFFQKQNYEKLYIKNKKDLE